MKKFLIDWAWLFGIIMVLDLVFGVANFWLRLALTFIIYLVGKLAYILIRMHLDDNDY